MPLAQKLVELARNWQRKLLHFVQENRMMRVDPQTPQSSSVAIYCELNRKQEAVYPHLICPVAVQINTYHRPQLWKVSKLSYCTPYTPLWKNRISILYDQQSQAANHTQGIRNLRQSFCEKKFTESYINFNEHKINMYHYSQIHALITGMGICTFSLHCIGWDLI